MSLKGTKTEKNILTAFAGESQARNRYTYFASVAKKEGYEQIAGTFADSADNEKEHAKRLFKFLEGGEVEISASFPAGVLGDTIKNLTVSVAGEKHEYREMYPDFAKIAEEEGFLEVASTFRAIAIAELNHERRFSRVLNDIKAGTVFRRGTPVKWRCRNCGYVHESDIAPEKCPACDHPQAYFEMMAENY